MCLIWNNISTLSCFYFLSYRLLNDLIEPLDIGRVLAGNQSPMFFGSAMNNFGVALFFKKCLEISTKPRSMETNQLGVSISPNHPEFTAYVFKLQANQDTRHRDRIAFVRVVSGRYEKGMKVWHSKKQITLSQAQSLFANEREAVVEAFPGDVSTMVVSESNLVCLFTAPVCVMTILYTNLRTSLSMS